MFSHVPVHLFVHRGVPGQVKMGGTLLEEPCPGGYPPWGYPARVGIPCWGRGYPARGTQPGSDGGYPARSSWGYPARSRCGYIWTIFTHKSAVCLWLISIPVEDRVPPTHDRTADGALDKPWSVCLLAFTQEDFLVLFALGAKIHI